MLLSASALLLGRVTIYESYFLRGRNNLPLPEKHDPTRHLYLVKILLVPKQLVFVGEPTSENDRGFNDKDYFAFQCRYWLVIDENTPEFVKNNLCEFVETPSSFNPYKVPVDA